MEIGKLNILKKSFVIPYGLVALVIGITVWGFIPRLPFYKIKDLPYGLEREDSDGDGVLDVYEAVKYSKKVFDTDSNGYLSHDEIANVKSQVEKAYHNSYYNEQWETEKNILKALRHIELEQKLTR